MNYARLRALPLFKELSDSEADALTEITSLRKVDKGQHLFFEGDRANGFYILLEGAVRIYKSAPDGRELTLHLIRPGQMFAEAAIFRGQTFPANAVTLAESAVAYFPKQEFLAMLEKSPMIAFKIIGSLAAWLREFALKLETLTLKEVPARLAEWLLRESPTGDTLKLAITKSALAGQLGTVSETLSRTLRRMSELGIIAVDGKQIKILDRDRLQLLAAGERVE